MKAYTGQFNDDKNWLTLTALTNGYIPSNTGVVLEADAADTYSLNIYREEEVMAENNALSGVAQSSPLEEVAGDNDLYILSKQNNVVAFYKYGGANVPAHKAFLLLPKPSDNSNAPAVRMVVETTSIENVTSPDFSTETTIYNLRGQRLQSMQAPGLYIVNGKKVLVK